MSRRMPFCALSGAMLALLPEARIAARKAQPWHSAAATLPALQAMAIFLSLGLGLALPFLDRKSVV